MPSVMSGPCIAATKGSGKISGIANVVDRLFSKQPDAHTPPTALDFRWEIESPIIAVYARKSAPGSAGLQGKTQMGGVLRFGKVGILVGGGPAPGINGVIAAATIEAVKKGAGVVGIFERFRWVPTGRLADKHYRRLGIDDVSRIHGLGGSLLQTSRFNPTKSEKDMQNVLVALRDAGISALVSIGGDDTAFSAYSISRRAEGAIRVAHVPKTIDNDLPLPGSTPTFGFE